VDIFRISLYALFLAVTQGTIWEKRIVSYPRGVRTLDRSLVRAVLAVLLGSPFLALAEPTNRVAETGDAVADVPSIQLRGDVEWLAALGLDEEVLSAASAEDDATKRVAVLQRYQQELVASGFYLARLSLSPLDAETNTYFVDVDAGHFGNILLRTKTVEYGDVKLSLFEGRYYTEKQLLRNLRGITDGEPFNYGTFYKTVFDINSKPDVTLNSSLSVRDDLVGRYADVTFFVEESLPLHGLLEVNNTGTEETEEWRIGLTAQHLNLTRHDDVLTLRANSSIDFSSVLSGAASYYLPHTYAHGGALTLYGGYAEVDAEEVVRTEVSGIDILGSGWFGGFQASFAALRTRKHRLALSVGAVYRVAEDQLVLDGIPSDPREATIVPLSLAVSYSSERPDFLRGRNYCTYELTYNIGDALGSTDEEDIQDQRLDAVPDYMVHNLQLARLQPLFGTVDDDGNRKGQWMFVAKAAGQLANGPLIPAEQFAVGGLTTVRGYEERAASGDHGAVGTLELQTPLFAGVLNAFLPEAAQFSHHIQFAGFGDAGLVSRDNVLQGEERETTIASAGVGLRFSLFDHVNARVDWAYPFQTVFEEDEGTSGRVHVMAQAQF